MRKDALGILQLWKKYIVGVLILCMISIVYLFSLEAFNETNFRTKLASTVSKTSQNSKTPNVSRPWIKSKPLIIRTTKTPTVSKPESRPVSKPTPKPTPKPSSKHKTKRTKLPRNKTDDAPYLNKRKALSIKRQNSLYRNFINQTLKKG